MPGPTSGTRQGCKAPLQSSKQVCRPHASIAKGRVRINTVGKYIYLVTRGAFQGSDYSPAASVR